MIKDKEYSIINVEKVGKCVLHYIDQEVVDEILG